MSNCVQVYLPPTVRLDDVALAFAALLDVTTVNEGKARAVLLDAALTIARGAIKNLRSG